MRPVSAKFVPRLLTDDQRENRVRLCRDLKSEVQNDPNFLKRIVTGDESWCYGYDPESKQASSQWKTPNSPRPKKAQFVPPGQTVNQHFYLDVLRRLRESVRRKRPEMRRNGNWLLHHDNAPAHTALTVRQFLTNNNMVLVPHPPYSPDLTPSDFFLFPRMKKCLKGKRFSDVDDVKENKLTALNSILPQEFQHYFQQWQKRWDNYMSKPSQMREDSIISVNGIAPNPIHYSYRLVPYSISSGFTFYSPQLSHFSGLKSDSYVSRISTLQVSNPARPYGSRRLHGSSYEGGKEINELEREDYRVAMLSCTAFFAVPPRNTADLR
ncbi:hypothetical protein ANN_09758 [Periplaneta americana]|uniref:Tc1-like transposase DDE domain-containing protein n=1 Tax=Periplaneta americana TaxID=6978 RepID=A0ABQ8TQU2_PERAM|nr:hypothetical protein ANN_09758 [Periplaneta americana]